MPVSHAATRPMSVSDHHDPRFAHLHEYFGLWAIDENVFQQLQAAYRPQIAAHLAHLAASEQRADTLQLSRYEYQVTSDGVALIVMRGSMMKFESSFGGCSTVATRRQLRKAAADDFVKSIVLVIDSPGGTVNGTKELADDVAKISTKKPVYAQIEDCCCSAAYWVASQCTKIYSNPTGMSGCIGTYMVVYDSSKMYEAEGIKTYVIRDGKFKGAGVPGTEITKEQLDHWQEGVDDVNAFFVNGVARGRKVPEAKAKKWADGRAFIASKSLAMGLIDGVQDLDATITTAAKAGRKPASGAQTPPADNVIDEEHDPDEPDDSVVGQGGLPHEVQADGDAQNEANGSGASRSEPTSEEDSTMSTQPKPDATVPAASAANDNQATNPAPISNPATAAAAIKPELAASIVELKAACPGASADFLLSQLEAGSSIATAQRAFIIHQGNELAALQAKQNAGAPSANGGAVSTTVPAINGTAPRAGLAKSPNDVAPTAGAGSGSGDPSADYFSAIADKMKSNSKLTRGEAAVAVMREQPALAEAYNAHINEDRKANDHRHAAARR